jgi:hypothetical protein
MCEVMNASVVMHNMITKSERDMNQIFDKHIIMALLMSHRSPNREVPQFLISCVEIRIDNCKMI